MDSSDSYKESVPGGGGEAVLPLYGLNGDVPLDRVWFSSSLSQMGYVILRGSEFVLNRIYTISRKSVLNRVMNLRVLS